MAMVREPGGCSAFLTFKVSISGPGKENDSMGMG